MDREATPARRLALPERDGCLVLGDTAATWTDGGEADLAAILERAADLSSTSDELAAQGDTWIRRYHLARERGHILRPLDVGPDDAVLEIGAGCGAVTRLLGEVAGPVDALEPTPQRARAAALRTRDLHNVAVLVGELEMLPREPAYDLIAAIGVLEYVGGAGDEAARVAFLREAAARLKPGGTLAVAIENRLGVKYLAGAPEDHANRPFEGLEEYPRSGPFRTFSRRELATLFAAAGLEAQVLHAFPDYKLPRLIYADALLASPAAALAWRVPGFPSYDSPLPRGRLASEYELWRGAVRAGLGGELANSFLVLAGRPNRAERWPERRLATFYTAGRRARYATETRVEDEAGAIWLRRRPLAPAAAAEPPSGGLEHDPRDQAFLEGLPLEEALERADAAQLARLLARWREHVEAEDASGGRNADPAPSNLLCRGEELVDIDVEWRARDLGAADVLGRALLHLAPRLADRRPPEQWPEGLETVGDLARHLAGLAGVEGLDLDATIAREAELQAEVVGGTVAEHAALARAGLERPLRMGLLGAREPELRSAAEARLAGQDRRVAELAAGKQALHDELVEASRERDALRGELVHVSAHRDELDGLREHQLAEIRALWERVDRAEGALTALEGSRAYRLVKAPRAVLERAEPVLGRADPRRRRHARGLHLPPGYLTRRSVSGTGAPDPPEVRPFADAIAARSGREVVVSTDLHRLADPRAAIGQLRAGRERGATIVVATPDRARGGGGRLGPPADPGHAREWTLEELRALLAAHGLEPEHTGYTADAQGCKRVALAVVEGAGVPAPAKAPPDFRVCAFVPCFNERDIVASAVGRLLDGGVEVVVLDNWSTDGSAELLRERFAGAPLRVEPFPAGGPTGTYDWAATLRRVAELAAAHPADWVLRNDADELREAPWPGLTLRDGLWTVQQRGYDAVDHTVLDFPPVREPRDGEDPFERMVHWDYGRRSAHFKQINAWRNRGPVELHVEGGHEAAFAGRRVAPYKFLLRHYPIRGDGHGARKVLEERRPRFRADERAAGWHVQYDAVEAATGFLRDPATLRRWDAEAFAREELVERLTGVGILSRPTV